MTFTINISEFLDYKSVSAEIEVGHFMGLIGTLKSGPTILSSVKDWSELMKHLEAAAENNWKSSEEYARLMERQITETFTQNNEDEKEEKGQCPDEWYDQRREDLRGVQDEHSNHGTGTSEQGSDRCINSSLY